MVLERDSHLRKSLLEELGIEHRIVRDNRQVANERINLLRHGRKRFRILEVRVANSRKRFDKRTQRHRSRLDQIVNGFSLDAILKTHQGHFDNFVLLKIETRRLQVNRHERFHFHFIPH